MISPSRDLTYYSGKSLLSAKILSRRRTKSHHKTMATKQLAPPAISLLAALWSGASALPALANDAASGPALHVETDSWVGYDGYGSLKQQTPSQWGKGQAPVTPWSTSGGWKVRRVNISMGGEVGQHFGYSVLVDPTYDGVLKNAVGYVKHKWVKFEVGQMKVPVSTEVLTAPNDLWTIERSAWATAAETKAFGFRRDRGADITMGPEMAHLLLGWYNGAGPNTAIIAPTYDLVARLSLKPVDMLSVDLAYLNGQETQGGPVGANKTAAFTRREDASLDLDLTQWLPLHLRGELLSGADAGGPAVAGAVGGADSELGYDAEVLIGDIKHRSFVVKYESWNPDTVSTGSAAVGQGTVTVGLNLVPVQGHEVQLDYSHDFLASGGSDDRVLGNFRFWL